MIRLPRTSACSALFGAAVLAVSLSACQTAHPPLRPPWLSMPKDEDGVFFYVDGHASGHPTPEAAREAAFKDAVRQIEEVLLADRAGQGEASLPLTQAAVLPEATYAEHGRDGYAGWVRVSFPQAERDRLLRRIEQGKRINAHWREARRLADDGDYAAAVQFVEQLLGEYRDPLFASCTEPEARSKLKELTVLRDCKARREKVESLWTSAQASFERQKYQDCASHIKALLAAYQPDAALSFSVEQAKLLLGQVVEKQKDFLEARRWYEDVAKSGKAPWVADATKRLAALPPPPRLWPMHDRWRGKKVALVCAIRNGGEYRRFGDLVAILDRDLRDSRIEGTDLTDRLDAEALNQLFDRKAVEPLKGMAAGEGAGIVLAVGFEIDPAKRGRNEEHFGTKFPAIDSTVRYLVVEPSIGFLACDDQFKEVAGDNAEMRLAERAASILIQKYLIPKCGTVP